MALFTGVAPETDFLGVDVAARVPLPGVVVGVFAGVDPVVVFAGVVVEVLPALSFFGTFLTGVAAELAVPETAVAGFFTGVALAGEAVAGFFAVD